MHYLKRQGIEGVGIDWSRALQRRSLEFDPTVRFDVGDLRRLPYPDHSFGSVLALGSVEHVVEGPAPILRELRRVLRPDGLAILTVPYFSPLKRVSEHAKSGLRESRTVRRLLGKPAVDTGSRRRATATSYSPSIWMDVTLADGEYAFFQYVFRPDQLHQELRTNGFDVTEIFPTSTAYGLLNASHGRLGSFDEDRELVRLGLIGRLLDWSLPAKATGHMLCAVATPSPSVD